jgi:hypothetical protein
MVLSEDETFERLIAQLAPIDRFEVRGILVDALTGIGRENRGLVQDLLGGSSFLGSREEAARLVAVRVACNLNMVDILAEAATHADAATRQMAIQYIYWFWQKDKRVTEALVEEIGRRVKKELSILNLLMAFLRRGKAVEKMYALRALIEVTVMMAGHLALEPERFKPVARVWGDIFNIFGIFRPLINKFAARFAARVFETALQSGVTVTFDALVSFLASPLNNPVRTLVIKLAHSVVLQILQSHSRLKRLADFGPRYTSRNPVKDPV